MENKICSSFDQCFSEDSETSSTQKRIAVYGGSFDPPTKSHMDLIDIVANKTSFFEEVWVIPCGKREDKPQMSEGQHRVDMLK